MAVYSFGLPTHQYVGASGDTKPTPVPCGSTFFEYDTKTWYICYDGALWTVLDDSIVVLEAIQAAVEA